MKLLSLLCLMGISQLDLWLLLHENNARVVERREREGKEEGALSFAIIKMF
jgi:hypothetical protein